MELKPCPFCGKEARYIKRWDDDEYDIACGTRNCFLEYGAYWRVSKEEVAELWNRRAKSDD